MRLSAHSLRLQPLWTRTDKPVIGGTNSGHSGEQLWRLIDALRADRGCPFTAGPAEALAAHELLIRLPNGGDGLAAYRDHLAPVFAKTVEHRSAFFKVFDGVVAEPVENQLPPRLPTLPATPTLPPPSRWERLRLILVNVLGSWPGRSAAVAVMLVIAASLLMVSQNEAELGGPSQNALLPSKPASSVQARPPIEIRDKPVDQNSNNPVARLLFAASKHSEAPTLREIARELSPSAPVPMTTDEYLRRLRDLTGLQPDRPLLLMPDIYSAGQQQRWRFAALGPTLAWAIGQIEVPGRAPTYVEILPTFLDAAADLKVSSLALYLENATIPAGTSLASALAMGRKELEPQVQKILSKQAVNNSFGEPNPVGMGPDARLLLSDPPDSFLARALALSHPDWRPSDAPWVPELERVGTTPNWVAFLVALLTLALFIPALIAMIDRRRAFLRRKPPLTAPHRTQLIRNLVVEPLGAASDFAEARKSLQRREPVLTRALDVAATITATIRAGGAQIVPRFAAMRSAPEYLVLIDRRNVNDLEAERAATLLDPLRTGAIGFDLFWFHTDPGWCTPEGEGPAVRIEELVARFPNHRLLLIGSGVEMIDLFAGGTRGGYAKLDHWHRRGMLTPVAREDWAREEWLIADAFKAPVGRATSGGLMTLAQHLLDEGKGKGVQLYSEGDDAAPAMPSSLVDNPGQFMGPKPPRFDPEDGEEDPLEDLLIELDYYPDRAGSEWLRALAVYPSVSFDLALYLGQVLRERAGDDTSPILLTPRRLAALTQLPWLRDGNLPDWLRRRLIERLTPARAGEVRALILGLIATAHGPDAEAASNRAMFGRERPAGTPAERLYDDEVLVDFLLEGKPEDFEVDVATAAEPLGWRERLVQADWLKLGTIALALAYGFAALWVTPGPNDGPAGMSMALPVIALIGAALTCAVMLRPMMVWARARAVLHRLGPWGLVLALLAIAALLLPLVERGTGTMLLPQGWGWRAALIALAVAMLPLSEWLSGWSFAPDAVRQRRGAGTLVVAALSLAVAWALVIGARADDVYGVYWLIAFALAGGALFWFGRRAAPLPLVPTEELKRQRHHTPFRRAAPLVAGLVLLMPVLTHVWLLRQDRTELMAASGYMPVIATSPDGLIAVSQPDERSVGVFDAARPDRMIAAFVPRQGEFQTVHRLAVTRGVSSSNSPAGARVVSVFDNGSVAVHMAINARVVAHEGKEDVPGATRIALSKDPILAISHLTKTGQTKIVLSSGWTFNENVKSDFSLSIPQITAIEHIEDNAFAFSAADGTVGVIDAMPLVLKSATERVQTSLLSNTPSLVSGARLIRALPRDAQGGLHFLVVADDGTAVEGVFGPGRTLKLLPKGVMKELHMGPVVPWAKAKVVVVPASQARGTRQIVPGPKCQGTTCRPVPPCPLSDCSAARTFFDLYREQFGTKLSQGQANGLESLVTTLDNHAQYDFLTLTEKAYLLATIKHETGGAYQPIEEYGGETYWRKQYGKDSPIGRQLGNVTDQDAIDYHGRGYAMTTGRRNYEIVGKLIGVDLVAEPDTLLQPVTAMNALLATAVNGKITGKKLSDFLASNPPDYVNARRVFNGLDQAQLIAEYAKKFEVILRQIDLQNQTRQGK